MKKALMFFACVVFSVASYAQLPIMVKAGCGFSNISGSDAKGADAKFAWKLGVGTEFGLGSNFYFQPSLYFVTKGAKANAGILDEDFGSVDAKITANANYLELPIMMAYRLNVAPNANLVFSAGPYLAYGVGGKTKGKASLMGYEVSEDLATFDSDGLDVTRFDGGIGVGVTGEFDKFLVGIEANMGLSEWASEIKVHNMTAFLTLGYKF